MLSKASKRLEQDRESVELVPQGEHHADLLDVVARRIPLKEISFTAFLLMYIKLRFFGSTVSDECLHEIL